MKYTIFKDPKQKKAKHPRDACRYNDGVVCTERTHCRKCGWNPAVSEDRLERFFERIMTEDPALYARLAGETEDV